MALTTPRTTMALVRELPVLTTRFLEPRADRVIRIVAAATHDISIPWRVTEHGYVSVAPMAAVNVRAPSPLVHRAFRNQLRRMPSD